MRTKKEDTKAVKMPWKSALQTKACVSPRFGKVRMTSEVRGGVARPKSREGTGQTNILSPKCSNWPSGRKGSCVWESGSTGTKAALGQLSAFFLILDILIGNKHGDKERS